MCNIHLTSKQISYQPDRDSENSSPPGLSTEKMQKNTAQTEHSDKYLPQHHIVINVLIIKVSQAILFALT